MLPSPALWAKPGFAAKPCTSDVIVLRTNTCLFLVMFGVSACSEERGELREWKASDHQAPAAVETGQGEAQQGGDSQAQAVAALWGMRCASCHGPSGRGDGADAPPGAQMPDFTRPDFQAARTDEKLAEAIFKGQGMMPSFGDQIAPAGIAALVGYIRTLKNP